MNPNYYGSGTHWIRRAVFDVCASLKGYFVQLSPWRVDVPQQSLLNYLEISASSRFVLCPRGYGTSSFRLYEAFQLGSIPVYISDDHALPWSDELDWNEFCVIVSDKEMADLDEILKSITNEKLDSMHRRGKEVYEQYFTLPAVFPQIMSRL